MSTANAARLGRVPVGLLVPGLIAMALLLVPFATLVAATPWRSMPGLLSEPVVVQALVITGSTSIATVAICLVLGTPLAWLLARVAFPGRSVLRALITVPLVLPPVVAGVALTTALGRNGFLGEPLRDLTGLTIPFTTTGVVVAHTFVAMPFYVLAVEGAMRSVGERYDVVAATLGAGRWTTFRRVTLPLALPGVLAGAILAWARSLGEFGATITFAGNYPGRTQTMPTLVFGALQSDPEVARALSMILLLVSLAILGALRNRWLVRP